MGEAGDRAGANDAWSSGGLTSAPIQQSSLTAGKVTTSTSQPGGGNAYDVAYDIWFNKTATITTQPNCMELMIWLNHNGSVQPFGPPSRRCSKPVRPPGRCAAARVFLPRLRAAVLTWHRLPGSSGADYSFLTGTLPANPETCPTPDNPRNVN